MGPALLGLWLVGAVAVGAHDSGEVDSRGDVGTCPQDTASFADVPPGHFARTDISCLNSLGIVKGTSAGTFSPDRPVTRAQTAAFLARLWRNVRAIRPESTIGFSDVPEGHFARTDISCLNTLGIVKGTSAGTFSPDGPVTRAQTAAFLARL